MNDYINDENLKSILFHMAKKENENHKMMCLDYILKSKSIYDEDSKYKSSKISEMIGRLEVLNALIDNAGLRTEYKMWVCKSTSCNKCYMDCSDGKCSNMLKNIVDKWESSKPKSKRNSGMSELYNYVVNLLSDNQSKQFTTDMLDDILDQSEKIECISERCEWLSERIPYITHSEIRDILLR